MQKKNFNFNKNLLDKAAHELRLLLDIHKPAHERRELEEKEHLQTFFNRHPIVLCTLAQIKKRNSFKNNEFFDLR